MYEGVDEGPIDILLTCIVSKSERLCTTTVIRGNVSADSVPISAEWGSTTGDSWSIIGVVHLLCLFALSAV